MSLRQSRFAGSWYPDEPEALRALVALHLGRAPDGDGDGDGDGDSGAGGESDRRRLLGVVAPHAGLVHSGPVAAHVYRAVAREDFDAVVLLGPSHQVAFDALAVYTEGAFQTPLGQVPIDEALAAALVSSSPYFRRMPEVHDREHCLEMQLPFLQVVQPRARIVPVIMGLQSPELVRTAAAVLPDVIAASGRSVLLVASSDLSHYEPRVRARAMDGRVLDCLSGFDPDSLRDLLEDDPGHACGGGPIVAVLEALRALGARRGQVLGYGDSGDTTGDTSSVVGYAAAAFWGEAA